MQTETNRYQLRRTDHEITDRAALEAILERALVARVGLIADGEPYVVPMNFVYADGRIILHGPNQGRFYRAVQTAPRLCIEVDEFVATLPHPVLCDYDTAYASVICVGTAEVIESLEERTEALRLFARKYAPAEEADDLKPSTVAGYVGKMEARTAAISMRVEHMTGKRQPFEAPTIQRRRVRKNTGPDLSRLGVVEASDPHEPRVVAPGADLTIPGAILKWYHVRPGDLVVPPGLDRAARAFLREEVAAERLDLGHGLGFVVLDYSHAQASLSVNIWSQRHELWQARYACPADGEPTFTRLRPGIDAPTASIWELAPLWHERESWVRYLTSERDDTAKQAYLSDRLVAVV